MVSFSFIVLFAGMRHVSILMRIELEVGNLQVLFSPGPLARVSVAVLRKGILA